MEGGGIPPPDNKSPGTVRNALSPSMEGGGIPPPDVSAPAPPAPEGTILQWRAGEFPRLTLSLVQAGDAMRATLQWRAGEFPRLT